MRILVAVLVLLIWAASAHADSCFVLFNPLSPLAVPIRMNTCTGETWILLPTEGDKTFEVEGGWAWYPVGVATHPKPDTPPPKGPPPVFDPANPNG